MRDLLSENSQKTLARRIHKTCQGKHNKIEDKERKRYRISFRNTIHDFSKKKRRYQRGSDGSKYRDQDPAGQPFLSFYCIDQNISYISSMLHDCPLLPVW